MLRPKKKITRKELKKDALLTSYARTISFYERHRKNIGMGITALVILIVGLIVYINNKRAENERAFTELGKTFELYDRGEYQRAIDGIPEQNMPGLRSIVENYGGTPAGNLARFYLANSYYKVEKYDLALEEFREFSASDPLLASSRLAGLGACAEALQNHTDAADWFERAAVKYPAAIHAAENLSHAARNYARAGQKEKARTLYQKLKKDHPASPFARDADRHIAQLSS